MKRGGASLDWKNLSQRLAAIRPKEHLEPHVLGFLRRAGGTEPWGIACSGGADSVALLCLLFAHFPGDRERMRVLHFNHGVRGREGDADAAFVADVAGSLELSLDVGGPPPGHAASEDALRRARFAFFDRAPRLCGRTFLFFGHNRDDIVETMLIRISRGSGTEGLCAPRPVHPHSGGNVHLRPLLSIPASEIRGSLSDCGIPWREDATNRSGSFFRNRLRHSVIPEWEKASPFAVAEGAGRSRKLLEEDEAALTEWLEDAVPAPETGKPLSLAALKDLPDAIVRRAVIRWLIVQDCRDLMSRKATEELLDAIHGACETWKRSVGKMGFLVLKGTELRLEQRTDPAPWTEREWALPPGGTLCFPGGGHLQSEKLSLDDSTRSRILSGDVDGSSRVYLEENSCGPVLGVRAWKNGDAYRPIGFTGTVKLQDAFVNRKIPRELRRKRPVIINAARQILWVPGLPPADSCSINKGTKRAVLLTYCCTRSA